MRIEIKEGVKLEGLQASMVIAHSIIVQVFAELGAESCCITSGRDGKHGEHSLHYLGRALDYRRWTIPDELWPNAIEKIKLRLGGDFDVVLESDHLHVEHDPK